MGNFNGFEQLREEFSGIFEDLSNLQKQAKEEFAEKNVTKAEQGKIINFIGKKMGIIGANMRGVQHHFEQLKRSGKLNKEEIHNIFKKFQEVNEFFGEIAHMGDDQKTKSEPEKSKKNQEMNKKDEQEDHPNGMRRPPMGKGKHHFGGMVKPPMGKHARPPMGKNDRERGPEGSEHFEGKNDEQDNQDDQEEHGQGMRPSMGKHSQGTMRPPMGKHPRPPMG